MHGFVVEGQTTTIAAWHFSSGDVGLAYDGPQVAGEASQNKYKNERRTSGGSRL